MPRQDRCLHIHRLVVHSMEDKAARQIYKRGLPLTERPVSHQGSNPHTGSTDGGDAVCLSTSYDAQSKRQHIAPAMHRGLDTPNSPWSTPECCAQPGFVTDSTHRGSGQSSSLPGTTWVASARQAAGEQPPLTGKALLEYCFYTPHLSNLPGSNS